MAESDHHDGGSVRTARRRVRRPAGPPAGSDPVASAVTTVDVPAPPATSRPTEPSAPSEAAEPSTPVAVSYRERRKQRPTVTGERRPRRWRRIAMTMVALAVLVGLIVVAVMFVVGTRRADDRAAQRAQYAAFARQMIVTLTSLDPGNVDRAIQTYQTQTSGKAMQQLQDPIQQTVDLIKSQNVSTKGTVLSDAVTASDDDSASVILVSGWQMTTPPQNGQPGQNNQPPSAQTQVQTFRWKAQIGRINGQLKLTDLQWVT
ncbi:hypothetical protein [Williamsia sterculiae]|uniref:Mce-associated membrane protein n=1 Tax=Williamsia sterculiae TaxID=1344003 RepID=A0A1N7CSP4_9NOCA|nr:hypothetical protein [Williamsia sterculiae]SIR66609.1 Mce-associated membrane protein [Williamsia sterculiae]